jgi:hypothetical protein
LTGKEVVVGAFAISAPVGIVTETFDAAITNTRNPTESLGNRADKVA